jgi:hypothetical protein
VATTLGRLLVDVAANAAGFEQDMRRVERSARKEFRKVSRELFKAERDLERARGKVRQLAGAFAAVGAVSLAGLTRSVQGLAREANSLDKFSRIVGLNVEQLQEFRFAAEQAASVSSQQFDIALQRFSRRVGEAANGTGELFKTVERLGIQLRDSNGELRSQAELFGEFSEAIRNAGTEQEQLAIAFKLFDSEGARLVNLLRLSNEELDGLRRQFRESGASLDQDLVTALVDAQDAFNVLRTQLKGIGVDFARDLIPPITEFLRFLTETEEGALALSRILDGLKTAAIAAGAIIGVRFAGSLGIAIAQLRVAQAEVTRLRLAQAALAQQSGVLAARSAALGRALRVLTGPVGIAVTVLGTLALTARDVRREMRQLPQEIETVDDRVRRLTQSLDEQRLGQLRDEYAELQKEYRRVNQALNELDLTQVDDQIAALDLEKRKDEIEALAAEVRDAVDRILNPDNIDGEEGGALGKNVEVLVERLNEFAADAAREAIKRAEEITESMKEMDDQIADTAASLGGPIAEALRDYQRAAQEVGELFRRGDIAPDQARQRLEQLGEVFRRDVTPAINEQIDRVLELTNVWRTLGIEVGGVAGGGSGGIFSSLGDNFARSIIEGGDILDSLGSSLRATGGQALIEPLSEVFGESLRSGLQNTFGDLDESTLNTITAGFSLALGQAFQGDVARGLGTAFGTAIGALTPLGGGVGGFLGGLIGGLFGDSEPKFQVRGSNPRRATDAGTDLTRNGPLGEINFAFREIEDEAATQVVNAFLEFDQAIASVIRDAGQLDAVREALERFGVSSRSDSESIEDLLRLRFDEIIKTFDENIQGFVLGLGQTLEEQISLLNDVRIIENLFQRGTTLGLTGGAEGDTFARNLSVIGRFRIGSESAVDTFLRLTTTLDALDRAADLTGNSLDGTRLDLVEFGAELVELFGDDADQFAGLLDRVLNAAFSDEELSQQTIDAAKQRATDLLTSLGITVTENTFTQEGLRQLLEDFLGNLGPEQTAILLEAGGAIATVIEELDSLTDSAEEAADATASLADQQAFLRDVGRQALDVIAPTRASFARLTSRLAENARRAEELGLSEEQLNIVRLSAQVQLQGFIASLSESIPNLRDQLFGSAEAADEAGEAVRRSVGNMRQAMLSAIDSIQQALDQQLVGPNSSLTNRERLTEIESQLRQAAAAALGGDADAARQVSGLFNQAIQQGAAFFGTSTDAFADFEARIRGIAGNVAANAPIPPEQETAANTRQVARNTQEIERSAFEQLQLATQLIDQIGLLSELTEREPSAIGEEFDIPIQDLIEILTGEVPDLTGDALAQYFNDLVAETNATLNEFARLEQIGLDEITETQETNRILNSILGALGGENGFNVSDTGPAPLPGPPGDGKFNPGPSDPVVTGTTSIGSELVNEVRLLRAETEKANRDRRTGTELTAEELAAVRNLLVTAERRSRFDSLRRT